jgi:hypothetical protein
MIILWNGKYCHFPVITIHHNIFHHTSHQLIHLLHYIQQLLWHDTTRSIAGSSRGKHRARKAPDCMFTFFCLQLGWWSWHSKKSWGICHILPRMSRIPLHVCTSCYNTISTEVISNEAFAGCVMPSHILMTLKNWKINPWIMDTISTMDRSVSLWALRKAYTPGTYSTVLRRERKTGGIHWIGSSTNHWLLTSCQRYCPRRTFSTKFNTLSPRLNIVRRLAFKRGGRIKLLCTY